VLDSLSVHIECLPIYVSNTPQELLSDSMFRVPIFEMYPTVVPPKQRLTGESAQAFRYALDIGEKVARREVVEDVL
jgi:hypothetical protein